MANNSWVAKEDDFALRQTIRDIPGFFSKQLTIDRGTRAWVVDDGVALGKVPPGTYTLKSFLGKLKFWRSAKQVDVVLVREEDVRLDVRIDKIATREELLVAVRLQMAVKLHDIALFAKNMMGSRSRVTISDLTDRIVPILEQALRESIRQLSIVALTSPEVRSLLETAVGDAAKSTLLQYGISSGDIHAVEIVNEQYDAMCRKTGEIWLLEQGSEKQKSLDEIFDRETLRKIERREREIDLNVLAEHVEIDGRQADVALAIRRNEVRRDMRDAMTAGMFDKTRTREEFDTFMLEIDKAKLLREEERDELRKMFEAKKEDRQSLRDHLLRKLDLQRKVELEELSAKIVLLEQESAEQIKRREYRLQKEMMDEQMEQLKAMEQLNRERECFEAELLLKTASEANAREIEKLKAMSQASVEALIASSDPENAKVLGDVEISKNESQTQATIREQAAHRERELQDQRVKDARTQSEVMLDTIQKITGQAFGAIGNVLKGDQEEK